MARFDPVATVALGSVASEDGVMGGAETGAATAAMMAALDVKWDRLERDYGAYDETAVAALAGSTPVDRLRESNGLVVYQRDGRRLYPGWQLVGGEVVDMRPVTVPLRRAGWSDDDIIMWLISPNAYLDGEVPPVAVLMGSVETPGGLKVPDRLATLALSAANPAW